MDEYGNLRYTPLNYGMIVKKEFWSISYAVKTITIYHLRNNKYTRAEDGKNDFYAYYNSVMDILKSSITNNTFPVAIRICDEDIIIVEKSKVCPIYFIVWARIKGLELPEEYIETILGNNGIVAVNFKDKSTDTISENNGKYYFQKSSKGWKLQFGDTVIPYVKDWVGMSYIKLLLQNPGSKIHVTKLQVLNAVTDDQEFSGELARGNADLWQTNDNIAIQQYKKELEKIDDEIDKAKEVRNKTRIQRLTEQREMIMSRIRESNFKPKDPEVEKIRKQVCKAIKDSIEGIQKLEIQYAYNNMPMSKHLMRFIRKGETCSYVVEGELLPPWKF